jgi:moderate conductance mechanosensitive channel
VTLSELTSWVVTHGLALLIGGLVLLVLYRLAQSLVPRVVRGALQVQQVALAGGDPTEELRKRASTLEDVLGTTIRAGFALALVLLVLVVFELLPLLAGLGLLAAALTLAGQAIVLDYLMGVLILIEGPYFKGDWVSIQGPGVSVEGEVEEITLRRTMVRDSFGALHVVSNGLVRVSSNLTRVYSLATVEVQVLRPADVERAIAVAVAAGRALADEAAWRDDIPDAPVEASVTALTLDGATIRLQRRVPPGMRRAATNELRRRLVAAFAEASIGTGRWDTPPLPAEVPVAAAEPPAG